MAHIELQYCGHIDDDSLAKANDIADCCETDDEFWAKIDKDLACQDPIGKNPCMHCVNCATRSKIYDVVVVVEYSI